MIRFLIITLALIAVSAQARVGETLQECELRYGPVVEHRKATMKASDPESIVFSKKGVTIVAEFHQGTVWKISYSKVGMDVSEVETLLAANAADATWSMPLKINGQEIRTTANRDRVAIYTPGNRIEATFVLSVFTSEFAKINRQEYVAKLKDVPAVLRTRVDNKPLKDF